MILDTSFLLDLKDRDGAAFEKGVESHGQTQRIVLVTAITARKSTALAVGGSAYTLCHKPPIPALPTPRCNKKC